MTAHILHDDDLAALVARHPEIFEESRRKSLIAGAVAVIVLAYLFFVWWFFSLGTVITNGRWDMAGAYLADWVSYESRPTVTIENGYLDIVFPRFDPMGNDPDPDWLETRTATVKRVVAGSGPAMSGGGASSSSGSFLGTIGGDPAPAGTGDAAGIGPARETAPINSEEVVHAVVAIGDAIVEIEPGRVTVSRGDEAFSAEIARGEAVTASDNLPDWATQRRPGAKIVASFGFAGGIEIRDDAVKIRHRFLGWANFLFDANSPFWGRSLGEVLELVRSEERIDPARSNLALAWSNILYNAEWQHLDVWTKLLQTIVMAFVGTLLATIVAFPLAENPPAAAVLANESVQIGPCVPNPGKIICVGLNYARHAAESGAATPSTPILFSKFNNSIAGPGDEVPLPANAVEYDYEAELVVVIGRTTRDVSEAEALDTVFGYCTGNDISARDLQMRTSQWLLGKTLDRFMPIGPYLVTADEAGDPQNLSLKCWLNGELRQDSNTADMIFSVAQIVSYASRYMTLEAGDIISTGTPEGVILGMNPKVWMKPGDTVSIEVEKLGTLTNVMVS